MTNTTDGAEPPVASGPSREIQTTAEMIASNVSSANRVAPSISEMSIIDDIYDFADKLRAGSTLRGKPDK
jgi:uncharacterized protein YwgA